MTGFVTSRHRLALLLVGLIGVPVWYSPFSPVALQLADATIASTTYEESFSRYAQIARLHWSKEVRAKALRRATLIHRLEGSSDIELNALLEFVESPEQEAMVQAQLGFYYQAQGRPLEAAIWLERAQQTWPSDSEAGQRLLMAARAREAASQLSKAEKLYERLAKRYKGLGAQADIGLAELLLASGKARSAKRYFERAARRAKTDDLSALAQFGIATCLERMGNLEEALAEMDELDLPPKMLDERRDGIRAHQASEVGGM